MVFNTKWNRKHSEPEPGGGKIFTERLGHKTMAQKVQEMIAAGVVLHNTRVAYEFASEKDIPLGFLDPTKVKGFGIEDAFALKEHLNKKFAEWQALEKVQEAEKKAKETSGEGKTSPDSEKPK